MRYQALFLLIVMLILSTACEDNKKATPVKKEGVEEARDNNAIEDSLRNTEKESPRDIAANYPKLTNENVVEFLSDYGKKNPETQVLLKTNHGDIRLELFNDAPLHRANFIYLIKLGYFDGTFFHRVVPNFIIQGGNSDNVSTAKKRTAIGKDYLLPAEVNNGRRHSYGSISGAKEYRENPDKRTAPFEFFIFLGPKTSTAHLDGNYTVFGRVTDGMEVVEKIANLPSDDGDWPLQNVYLEAEIIQ